jgi:hypothetical protein
LIKLDCGQQTQRCIVSNTSLANEGHCIDLGIEARMAIQKRLAATLAKLEREGADADAD